MGFLKNLDIFKSINSEHKEGTILGSLLTLISFIFIFVFFFREMKVYRSQQLSSKLYVDKNDYSDQVTIYIDILFFKIECNTLILQVS